MRTMRSRRPRNKPQGGPTGRHRPGPPGPHTGAAHADGAMSLQWHSVGRTHTGLRRRHNEDAFLERVDLGLWAVADGMGGMTAGEVASGAVVAALDGIAPGAVPGAAALMHEVRARLHAVNGRLRELAARRGVGVVIGSTVAGLLLHGRHFAALWAGDSRVYRHRGGDLDRLTRDHSLVQAMVDAGVLAPRDAEAHPHASVIQRAVGVGDRLELDVVHARAEAGDTFLLCSDGLTRVVADEEIERLIGPGPLEPICEGLLRLVLERGAPDNVTAILVRAR